MGGLFNSTVLDVAIGLIFVYLLLGILCTTVNEWISGILGARAKNLQQGISGLLDSQSLGNIPFLDAFYQHPLISGMMRDGNHPSYLASRAFATAIMDLVTPTISGPITLPNLVDGINALPPGDVKKALAALLSNADGDLTKAQKNIEHWFDDTMDRVSGWYKRTTQIWTIVIAVFLTVLANADTINIARRLWVDPTVRNAVVEQAKQVAQTPLPTGGPSSGNTTLIATDSKVLGNMLGWTGDSVPADPEAWFERFLGWLFTAIAVSLGAPFWFDTLNRFVNLRNAGTAPVKSST
jgi:hypothetical protein